MPNRRPTFYKGELGHYFRDLRKKHGWSSRRAVSVAGQKKLPVSLGALKWLEGGLTKKPEPELLRALSVLYAEPYANIVQEVAKHVFDIKPEDLRSGDAPAASVEDFVTLPLLATPIATKWPLVLERDPQRDCSLAFRKEVVRTLTRPVCLRLGPREQSMVPTILPGDAVLIDQNIERRRHRHDGQLYVVNLAAQGGDDHGAAIKRIETGDGTLILTADHPDKTRYPTLTSAVRRQTLAEILVGEVVWIGRDLRGKRRRLPQTRESTRPKVGGF